MPDKRVVVTGVGVISPLGLNVERHWERLQHGESGVTVASGPHYQNLAHPEGRVDDFDRRTLIPDRMLRKLLSPSASLPHVAASEAIDSAGLAGRDDLMLRCGLYVGSIGVDVNLDDFVPAVKESITSEGNFELGRFGKRGMKLLDPLFLVKALPNAGLCGISIQHRIFGPNANVTNGTVSGLQAVAIAAAAIRRGEINLAVAGGYDSLLRLDEVIQHTLDGRLSRRANDPQTACRPFDMERDGFPVGEGAAFVVLEEETHASAREAPIFGELLGIAQTTDAGPFGHGSQTADDGVALEQAARQALRQGACHAEELGAIFGDGLATEEDDVRESATIRRLVNGAQVPFTAATAALGFTGAASGTFSLVHALLGLRDQAIPPLINCQNVDPRCRVHIATGCEHHPHTRSLMWSSDRGLKNVAMLLGTRPNGV